MTITIFQAPGGTLNVEVGAEAGTSGAGDVSEFGRAIVALVSSVSRALNDADDENAPKEVTVRFGLTTTARGAVAVCLGQAKANIQVEFKWSASGDAKPEDFT